MSPRSLTHWAKPLVRLGSRPRIDGTTLVELATVTLIWGSTWLVIKGQLGTVPSAWSVSYRFIIASSALLTFTVATGRWRWPRPAGHAFAALVGLAQFMLNFNLVYAAEARLKSGLVALVFALLVVPNTLLSRLFYKTHLTRRFVCGTAVSIGGLFILFGPNVLAAGQTVTTGLLLVGTAVLSASLANVAQAGTLARSLPPLPMLGMSMAYGAMFDTIYARVTSGPPVVDGRLEYWGGLIYLALGASVIAFTLYYRLIRRIGAGPAAYTSVVVPVVALFLSAMFEGYRLTPTALIGASLALVGLAVALSQPAVQLSSARSPAR